MTEPWEHAARIATARHRPPHLERDDALQIARLAAWEASQRWQPDRGANELTWCIQRATGALRDEVRAWTGRRTKHRRPLVTVPLDQAADLPPIDPPAPPDRSPALEHGDLLEVLEALPASCWPTAVRLAYGDRPIDVARADGVTDAAVSQRLKRMRLALAS